MRVLYLTQWFDPEPVMKGLGFVRGLQKAGYEVTVVTGIPNYPTGKIYPDYKFRLFQKEQIENVSVIRLPLYPSHNTSSVGRAINYLSFFLSVLVYGLFRGHRYDLAYVYHPPITVGLAAALFSRVKRIPFIIEIQDLWPDTVAESNMRGTRLLTSSLSVLCNFVYERASSIIVQSEGMNGILIKRGVPPEKLHVIRNWADESALATSSANMAHILNSGKFTIVYGGNLGRMQALDKVILAAQQAGIEEAELELLLIGDGVESKRLRLMVEEQEIANVRILPRISKIKVAALFAQADALLMHLADRELFSATIPMKTQFYLAMGRPILAGISGEAREILVQSGAAILAAPEDTESLCDAMLRMKRLSKLTRDKMGRRGREYYLQSLSFDRGIEATIKVISDVADTIEMPSA